MLGAGGPRGYVGCLCVTDVVLASVDPLRCQETSAPTLPGVANRTLDNAAFRVVAPREVDLILQWGQ